MSVLTVLWSMVAAACLSLAAIQFFIWLNQRKSWAYLLLSIAGLAAMGNAICELFMLRAVDIPTYELSLKISVFCITILLISLVWFVAVYFRTAQKWLLYLITLIYAILMVIDIILSKSLPLSSIDSLKQVFLPWGDSYSIAVGARNPLALISDFASLLVLIYFADASFRLWRQGNRRRSLMIGGSSIFFITLAGIHTPLVDAGILHMPYIISFSFLAIIIAMSIELSRDVLRASELSQEVAAGESRWHATMENIELLAIGLDTKGIVNYVNPFAQKLMGYTQDEFYGKEWIKHFIPESKRGEITHVFQDVKDKDLYHNYINPVSTKQGEIRQIAWSNAKLFSPDGSPTGTFSIGADITEVIQSRQELEKSYAEVKELKERLQEENIYLQEEIILDHNYKNIIGKSDVLKYALARVDQVAQTDMTVLIEGETGVGKELFARGIHQESSRQQRPLVKINCAVIPSNLIESELFGHVKGAFTGADRNRTGRFELADKATLFLDEIGELPLDLQPKLLRVLEEGEFEPLGSNKTRKVDVRIIAATNRVLKDEIEAGRFREDLYYRLNVFPISIPPLRERTDDIPLLVEFLVDRYSRKLGKKIEKIPSQALKSLFGYSWPGNIRELNNIIERAVMATNGASLFIADELRGLTAVLKPGETEWKSMDEMERDYIVAVLKEYNWKIEGENGAAQILDMHPNTLRNRMRKLGIERPV